MTNAVFPAIKEYMEGPSGLDFANGKFRIDAVDIENAGPSPGAWKIASWTNQGVVTGQTNAPHGLSVGDKISVKGVAGTPPARANSTQYLLGDWATPPSANAAYQAGEKFVCVEAGTSGGSQPSWQTKEGYHTYDGSVVWECRGAMNDAHVNGMQTVIGVPSSNTFYIDPGFRYPLSGGWIANLSKTYLSEFAGAAARVASDPLTGKQILPGGVLDCNDFALDGGPVSREVLLLVKAAGANADPDLADSAQRLVAYWDAMPGLPIAPNLGLGTYAVNNGPDRLMRL